MSVVGGGAEGGGGGGDNIICGETDAAGAFLEEAQAARAAYTDAKAKNDVAVQNFALYTGQPDGKAFVDEQAYKAALANKNAAQTNKTKYEDSEKDHRSKKGYGYDEIVLRMKNATMRLKETEAILERAYWTWRATQHVKNQLSADVKIATDEAKAALKKLNRYTIQATRGFEDVEGCPMVSLIMFVCAPAAVNRPNPRLTLPPPRSSSAGTNNSSPSATTNKAGGASNVAASSKYSNSRR